VVSVASKTKPGKEAYTMAKITPIRSGEQFEHFPEGIKREHLGRSVWKTRPAWKQFWEAQSLRERDSYYEDGLA
jgi:hypothetical protein